MNIDVGEIYELYFKDVYYFILAMSKDPHIAEEITRETFFRALKECKHFHGNAVSVRSWLCRIAKNLYLNRIRKNPTLPAELIPEQADDSDPETDCIQREGAISIYKILHCLDEPYKEVFTLRALGDLSFREIGDIFGKHENWARVTYHRARIKIRDRLTDSHEKGV